MITDLTTMAESMLDQLIETRTITQIDRRQAVRQLVDRLSKESANYRHEINVLRSRRDRWKQSSHDYSEAAAVSGIGTLKAKRSRDAEWYSNLSRAMLNEDGTSLFHAVPRNPEQAHGFASQLRKNIEDLSNVCTLPETEDPALAAIRSAYFGYVRGDQETSDFITKIRGILKLEEDEPVRRPELASV